LEIILFPYGEGDNLLPVLDDVASTPDTYDINYCSNFHGLNNLFYYFTLT